MQKRHAVGLLTLVALLLVAAGCNFQGGGNIAGSGGSGKASLFLTDAASNDLKEVNVTITEVQANRDGAWETLNTFPDGYPVNLLDLRFDEALLGTASLPAGAYTQLRLIVDDGAVAKSNVVDQTDTVWPLKVPSGAQTGLKINHDFTVPAGGTVALVLDVNVLDFVHKAGNSGKYIINPTAVRVVDKVVTGALAGRVLDSATEAAISDTDVVATLRIDADDDGIPDDVDGDGVYSADLDYVAQTVALREDQTSPDGTQYLAGEFQINAVPQLDSGSYILEVTADGYQLWSQAGIHIVAGETTEIDGDTQTTATDPILLTATP